MNTSQAPTKPSLKTCAQLIIATTNLQEAFRAISAALNHYTLREINAAVSEAEKKNA